MGAHGTTFRNAGECTSYAANGGTLQPLDDRTQLFRMPLRGTATRISDFGAEISGFKIAPSGNRVIVWAEAAVAVMAAAMMAMLPSTPASQPSPLWLLPEASQPLPSIFPGSWINGDFYIWIGHRDDHRADNERAPAKGQRHAPAAMDHVERNTAGLDALFEGACLRHSFLLLLGCGYF